MHHKNYLIGIIIGLFSFQIGFGLEFFDNLRNVYTKDITAVVQTSGLDNPLRDGFGTIATGIQWLVTGDISSTVAIQKTTFGAVQSVINILLSFLSLVALIYLIYHGYIWLLGATSDDASKKSYAALQNAVWAIGWIGLSRLIVTTLFAIVAKITGV